MDIFLRVWQDRYKDFDDALISVLYQIIITNKLNFDLLQ